MNNLAALVAQHITNIKVIMAGTHIDASCFLVLSHPGKWVTQPVKFRATKNAPKLSRTERAVKIKLRIPLDFFRIPTLTVNAVVPEDAITEIQIDAETQASILDHIKKATGLDVTIAVVESIPELPA